MTMTSLNTMLFSCSLIDIYIYRCFEVQSCCHYAIKQICVLTLNVLTADACSNVPTSDT